MIVFGGAFLHNKQMTDSQSHDIISSKHTSEMTSAPSIPEIPVYAQSGLILKNIYAAGTRNGETLLVGKL
jgi:hypothetical protein